MITETRDFVTKYEIAKLLNLKNDKSVLRYHKYWIDGVHFFKNPGGNRSGYTYVLPLIQHWNKCCRKSDDRDHLIAIQIYQQSRNPRRKQR